MYVSLTVTTPPAVEPLDVVTLRRHARIDFSDDDDLLASYLATARTLAENWMGRAFITQTLRYTLQDIPPMGALPLLALPLLVVPVIQSFPAILAKPIELPRGPVSSIVSVKLRNGDGTTQTLDPASDYLADTDADPCRLRLMNLAYPHYAEHVEVNFIAGYGDTAAAVPAPIVTAVAMIASYLYEHRGDDQGSTLPRAAFDLMTAYRMPNFG